MKYFALACGILFAIYYILDEDKFVFIDNFNLMIHEFGHMFFSVLGNTVGLWGGTIMQLLLPAILIWYFYSKQDKIGIYFSTYLLGENFLNVSRYVADAQEMALPLFSPGAIDDENVIHDWNAILSSLNLLQYDDIIAFWIAFLGWIIIIFSMVWLIFQKNPKEIENYGNS